MSTLGPVGSSLMGDKNAFTQRNGKATCLKLKQRGDDSGLYVSYSLMTADLVTYGHFTTSIDPSILWSHNNDMQ